MKKLLKNLSIISVFLFSIGINSQEVVEDIKSKVEKPINNTNEPIMIYYLRDIRPVKIGIGDILERIQPDMEAWAKYLSEKGCWDKDTIDEMDQISCQNYNISYSDPEQPFASLGVENFSTIDMSNNELIYVYFMKDINTISGDLVLNNTTLRNNYGLLNLQSVSGNIYLQNNTLKDLKGFIGLQSVNDMYLQNNNITNLEGLELIQNVRNIYLENNPVRDLTALSNVLDFGTLYIDDADNIKLPEENTIFCKAENFENIRVKYNNQWVKPDPFNSYIYDDIITACNIDDTFDYWAQYLKEKNTNCWNSNNLYEGLDLICNNSNISYEDKNYPSDKTLSVNSADVIYMNNNNINSLSFLSSLDSVNSLAFSDNALTSITGLSKLASINSLNLRNNNISNISGLSNLTGITNLYLSGNNLSNVSGIENINDFYRIELNENPLSDISGLKNIASVNYLFLDKDIEEIISPTSETAFCSNEIYKNLYFYENGNQIKANPLNSQTYITLRDNCGAADEFDYWAYYLKSKSSQCWYPTSLSENADLSDCDGINISNSDSEFPRGKDFSIQTINQFNLRSNNLTDINFLSNGITDISRLDISLNNIQSLSGIENININNLYSYGNPLNDISALENLNISNHLYITGSNITNVDALSNYTSFNYLRLYNNDSLNDITGLSNINSIGYIYIDNTFNPDNIPVEGSAFCENEIYSKMRLYNNNDFINKFNSPLYERLLESCNKEDTYDYWGEYLFEKREDKRNYGYGSDYCVNRKSLSEGQELRYCYDIDLDPIDAKYPIGVPLGISSVGYVNMERNSLKDVDFLKGVKNATSSMNFRYNQIENLDGMIDLTEVSNINLSGNNISNISGLQNISKITGNLYLTNNNISDITGLNNLQNIHSLTLSNNDVSDLSPLSKLTTINGILNLQGNSSLTSLNGLNNLTSFNEIHLKNTSVNDISALSNVSSAERLTMPSLNISNIVLPAEGSAFCTNRIYEKIYGFNETLGKNEYANRLNSSIYRDALETCNMNDEVDYWAIYLEYKSREENDRYDRHCVDYNTTELSEGQDFRYCASNNLSNSDPNFPDVNFSISEASNIRFNNNKLTNIDFMNSLTTINGYLYLYSNELTNVDGLSNITSVNNLYLNNNNIENINGLSNLTSANRINLHNNNLLNINGLSGITQIDRLTINNNPSLDDISGLSNLSSVTTEILIDDRAGYTFPTEGTSFCSNKVFEKIKIKNSDNQWEFITPTNSVMYSEILSSCNIEDTFDYWAGYLNDSKGCISTYDMSTLSGFNCSGKSISSIDENYPSGKIMNINPIMTNIYLYNNSLENVDFLSNLTEVNNLRLENNNLSNIDGISNVTTASNINLKNNPNLSNMSALSNLDGAINTIDIINTNINEILPLKNIDAINNIYVDNNFNPTELPSETSDFCVNELYNKIKFSNGNQINKLNSELYERFLTSCNKEDDFDYWSKYLSDKYDNKSSSSYYSDRRVCIDRNAKLQEGHDFRYCYDIDLNPSDSNYPHGYELPISRVINLNLSRNNLEDVSFLRSVNDFSNDTIYLNNNNLTNLDGLQNLVSHNNIYAYNNSLSSVLGLDNLESISYLRLDNNSLNDLSSLSSLSNARTLYLYNNNLTNLNGLNNLLNIDSLFINNNPELNDISALSNLETATSIRLDNRDNMIYPETGSTFCNNKLYEKFVINNSGWVKATPNNSFVYEDARISCGEEDNFDYWAEYLNSEGCIATYSIEENDNITCSYNKININDENYPAGKSFINTSLGNINFYRSNLNDLSFLNNLNSINYLRVDQSNLNSLNGLDNLTALDQLQITSNNLENLNQLSNINSMINLYAGHNNINDLSGLLNLSTVEQTINLSNNSLLNLNGLNNLTSVQNIDLEGNNITDISALSNLSTISGNIRIDDVDNIISPVEGTPFCINQLYEKFVIKDNNNNYAFANPVNSNIYMDMKNTCGVTEDNFDYWTGYLYDKGCISELSMSESQNLSCYTLNNLDENYPDGKKIELSLLSNVYLQNSTLSNLDFLSNIDNLYRLNVQNTGVENVDGLSKITSYYYLNLENNNLNNINGLSNATNFNSYLYLNNNEQLNDYSGLSNVSSSGGIRIDNRDNMTFPSQGTAFCENNIYENFVINDNGTWRKATPLNSFIYEDARMACGEEDNFDYWAGYLVGLGCYSNYSMSENTSVTCSTVNYNDTKYPSGETFKVSSLNTLNLRSSTLNSLDFLSTVNQINTMYFENLNLTDINGLSNLNSFNNIYLRNNELTTLSPLSNVSGNVSNIYIDNNNLSNLNGLNDITSANIIYVMNNPLTDISALANLSSLRYIKIDNNMNITNAPKTGSNFCTNKLYKKIRLPNGEFANPVNSEFYDSIRSSCGQPDEFDYWGYYLNKVVGCYPEPQIDGTQRINCGNRNITPTDDGYPTGKSMNIDSIQQIYLYNNNLTDIDFLKGVNNITNRLLIRGNNISSLDGIENTQINSIDAQYNPLTDFSAISNNVGSLNISNSNINSISTLSNMTTIGNLNISENNITDIRGLRNLTTASKIFLDDNDNMLYPSATSAFCQNRVFDNMYINNNGTWEVIEPLNSNIYSDVYKACNYEDEFDYWAYYLNQKGCFTGSFITEADSINCSNKQLNKNDTYYPSEPIKLSSISGIDFSNNFFSDTLFLNNITTVNGDLHLDSNILDKLNGMNNITKITGNLYLDDNQITDLSALSNLESVNNIYIDNEDVKAQPSSNSSFCTNNIYDKILIKDVNGNWTRANPTNSTLFVTLYTACGN